MASAGMSSIRRAAAERVLVVRVPSVELRRLPDHRSECVTECLMGSRLRVLGVGEGGRWLRVLAPDGYLAWARSWGMCDEHPLCRGAGVFVQVLASAVRAQPRLSSAVVTPVWMGCRLGLLRASGRGWRAVATPDGRTGWIASRDVAADAPPERCGFWSPHPRGGPKPGTDAFRAAARAKVIGRARSLLGVPYRWGGTSAAGLDCSGLVRLVFGLEGVALPRDARDQEKALVPWRVEIDPARLRAGDLVFFGPGSGHADHVGLGIGGRPGRFIHGSGCVRISGLAEADRLCERELRARVRVVARPAYRRRYILS